MTADLRVLPDGQAVARASADLFVERVARSVQAGQPFRVALSGGSTPKMLYQTLSSPDYRDKVKWDAVEFFFGDERWVAHDDPDSNYGLARDELFNKVPVDPDKIFPIPTRGLSPEDAAAQYEATIARQFGTKEGEMPEFELIYLGMGDDGHTASCFPMTDALDAKEQVVVANFVPKLRTYRITLTPPALQAAKEVVFMIAGQGKAPALHEVLEGEYAPVEYPSQLLRYAHGEVVWCVDSAAASQLDGQSSKPTQT